MFTLLRTVVFVALSGLALAIPAPTKTIPLDKRAISGVTAADCDGFTFTAAQVSAAASAAASRVASGTTVGSNSYPHVFNNREGFTFNSGCRAPFYEFPLFRSQVYTGGDPSYNRVVIGSVSGSNAAFCDVITHFGATGSNFLQCDNA
ncbi:guanyl-specific ribonuclease F1 [Ceratobasidium sp. AG-Ba]|nr:guanyl-specific ribonuclease F1 [Ceratobasidium sp. AG-Ba]